LGPNEGFGAGIVLGEIGIDGGLQVDDRAEHTTADAMAGFGGGRGTSTARSRSLLWPQRRRSAMRWLRKIRVGYPGLRDAPESCRASYRSANSLLERNAGRIVDQFEDGNRQVAAAKLDKALAFVSSGTGEIWHQPVGNLFRNGLTLHGDVIYAHAGDILKPIQPQPRWRSKIFMRDFQTAIFGSMRDTKERSTATLQHGRRGQRNLSRILGLVDASRAGKSSQTLRLLHR
jgi:hypothetical protein